MQNNLSTQTPKANEHFSVEVLKEFEQQLLSLKKQIEQESIEVADTLKNEESNDPDYYNRAISEVSTSITLRATHLNTKILNDIEIALKKIYSGEYGYCEITGEVIGINRLKAVPYTKFSISAQEQIEKKNKYEE
ncbi:MAG: TraR/DksA C4-type zinc finger protein [Rickettsiales bacterium]